MGAAVFIAQIDPATDRLNHTVSGNTYKRGQIYEVSKATAEILRGEYVQHGIKRSGNVFLVETPEEARTREQQQLDQAQAPRGTIDHPIRVAEKAAPAAPPTKKRGSNG